jgi:response regulator RpfG family c-di-GMP phosphodiesterase
MNILVVDDDPIIRNLLDAYLREFRGNNVFLATDGMEGLNWIQKIEMDCVFMDMYMPGFTGLETLGRIKQISPDVMIVIMTGQPSFEIMIEAIQKGASDFLIKPFQLEQVSLTLERLTKEKRLLNENKMLTQELRAKKTLEDLNRKLEKKVKEQTILYTITDQLSRVRGKDDLFKQIVRMAGHLTEAPKVSFFIWDREEDLLRLIAGLGIDSQWINQYEVPVGQGIVGRVAQGGVPVLCQEQREWQPQMEEAPQFYDGSSFLALPLKIRQETFGVLQVAGRPEGRAFTEQDLFLLSILSEKAAMTIENIALYENVVANLYATLRALVNTIEAKDPYTMKHSERVTQLAMAIARKMNRPEEEIAALAFAGPLHDIGKIGVQDYILLKPSKLNPEEFDMIKMHPTTGERIINELGISTLEKSIIRHHHERWDGRGYPDGLREEEIPILCRIISAADAYDAMTSDRSYRKALTQGEALAEMSRCSRQQFDPEVVATLMAIIREGFAPVVAEWLTDQENAVLPLMAQVS